MSFYNKCKVITTASHSNIVFAMHARFKETNLHYEAERMQEFLSARSFLALI